MIVLTLFLLNWAILEPWPLDFVFCEVIEFPHCLNHWRRQGDHCYSWHPHIQLLLKHSLALEWHIHSKCMQAYILSLNKLALLWVWPYHSTSALGTRVPLSVSNVHNTPLTVADWLSIKHHFPSPETWGSPFLFFSLSSFLILFLCRRQKKWGNKNSEFYTLKDEYVFLKKVLNGMPCSGSVRGEKSRCRQKLDATHVFPIHGDQTSED